MSTFKTLERGVVPPPRMPVANEGLIGLGWVPLLKNIMILVVTGILDRGGQPNLNDIP